MDFNISPDMPLVVFGSVLFLAIGRHMWKSAKRKTLYEDRFIALIPTTLGVVLLWQNVGAVRWAGERFGEAFNLVGEKGANTLGTLAFFACAVYGLAYMFGGRKVVRPKKK